MKLELNKPRVKYPTKRSINLARRENNRRDRLTLYVGLALIVLLCVLVAKFAVIDQFARLRAAESAYEVTHSQYLEMQQALEEYPAVEKEYHTYSRAWMQTDQSDLLVSVDRSDVLDLVENWLMPYGHVNTLTAQGDMMIVTMSGMNLEQISAMFTRLQQQPIVKSATLTIASTANTSSTEALDFSVTVNLQPAEEANA